MIVTLCPVHDVYVEGNECAVYAGDDVAVLSPVATSIVLQLQEGAATPEQLAYRVERQFGAPPGISTVDAVTGIVHELVQTGVVQVTGSSA